MDRELRERIETAVTLGIHDYVAERHRRIPAFVERTFSLRGAFALHRRTFGRDFYKHPLNMMWAPPALLVHGVGALLERTGARRLGERLGRLPLGLETALERELAWRVHTDLLELPYLQRERSSERDALMEAVLARPEVAALCEPYLAELHARTKRPEARAALERNLAEYGKTRVGVTDLAGTLISVGLGYAAFQHATPGALSAGGSAAAAIAQQLAIANFALGPTLGSIYYGIFPASASAPLLVAATGAWMASVGVLAALAWVVIDPVLARTGVHERRLARFVDAVGDELRRRESGYRVREHYVARVFDVIDLLRSAVLAAR